jgi:hypothetical protein
MNKNELLKALSECFKGDEEINHIEADDLLLEYINDSEIKLAFESIKKWYA